MWNLKNMSMTRSVTGTSKSLQVPIVWWEERSSQKNHNNHNNDNMFAKTKIHLKNKTSFDAQKQNSRERLITLSLSFSLIWRTFCFSCRKHNFLGWVKAWQKSCKKFFSRNEVRQILRQSLNLWPWWRQTEVRTWGSKSLGLNSARNRAKLDF